MPSQIEDARSAGSAAFRRRAWREAYEQLAAADAEGEPTRMSSRPSATRRW